jgi:hypothetical protein
MGIQRVTRVLNPKSISPNIFAAPPSFWTHFRRYSAAFGRLAPPGGERVQAGIESVYVARRWRAGSSWSIGTV